MVNYFSILPLFKENFNSFDNNKKYNFNHPKNGESVEFISKLVQNKVPITLHDI